MFNVIFLKVLEFHVSFKKQAFTGVLIGEKMSMRLLKLSIYNDNLKELDIYLHQRLKHGSKCT